MKTTFPFKSVLLGLIIGAASVQSSYAQGDCYSMGGCSDFANFGYNSTTAATLEYDNYVSGFHSTVVRDIDGTMKIWGEMTKADGANSYLVPTPINPGNYPGITGKPLKVGIASGTIYDVQYVLLTDNNKLWTWGKAGPLFDASLTTNTFKNIPGEGFRDVAEFQELSIGLPSGVSAANVKMLFATYENLLITTCSGEVYALVQYWGNVGNGGTSATNVWHKVQKSAAFGGGDLTGIVAARGGSSGFMALDNTGNLWTWGYKTYNGTGAATTRNAAVQMALPAGASGNIKMIGMTGAGSNSSSYYVLYGNGNLYALGDNDQRQLGNWTTTSSDVWIQPRYTSGSGPVMNNIKWISPQEHDGSYRNISVINADKKIFNWGQEDKFNLGRGIAGCSGSTTSLNPGEPVGFSAGYNNSGIVSIETGGHTFLAMRECESNFGYVGHRVNGSMGDNNPVDQCDNQFHFATSAVEVCGSEVVDAVLNASVEGPYYVGNTVTLIATPSGGTYTISALSTASASLTDSVLVFTGAGTLRVEYAVVAGSCGLVKVSKTFNVASTSAIVTIPGNIWNDANGNAVANPGETGIGNEMWANLTDPNGIVIASVKVNKDGTYKFEVSTGDLSTVGNYTVVLTANSRYKGDILTGADQPAGDYEYTGTNLGGTGNTANKSGMINIGNLSTITGTTTTAPANFGIQRPPSADPKAYTVLPTAFSTIPPAGYPVVSGFNSIPMNSPALTGYSSGGSLSGTDQEDCSVVGSCNTGTNSTFVINTINANTKLFYDFGAGPVAINGSGGPVSIPNFDASKMVIYGANGQGTGSDALGFTYSLIDRAGAISTSVNYVITTSAPLPVTYQYFTAKERDGHSILEWGTVSEHNNKGFYVERSADGANWLSIEWLNSKANAGSSNTILAYSYTDKTPLNGINFYRLKQVDVDGRNAYSTVRTLTFKTKQAIMIYPNPAKENVTVSNLQGGETIALYDMTGRVVNSTKVTAATMMLDISKLEMGIYSIRITTVEGKTSVYKLTVN